MLTKRIIPCLDVKDNRVVKGVNFLNLRDAGDNAFNFPDAHNRAGLLRIEELGGCPGLVDYVDGLTGSGFKFDNPNAKTTCECGETFEA